MSPQRGFTLIELAIVLVILTILAGGLMVPMANRIKNNQIQEARKYLADVNEALIGFAIQNKRLPCPSIDENGDAAPPSATASCNVIEGYLPYKALGVSPTDPWGNTLRYRVSSSAGGNVTEQITQGTEGNIQIKERKASDKTLQGLDDHALAIVLSLGPNGKSAVPVSNIDESENRDASNSILVTRVLTEQSSNCSDTDATPGKPLCEFDDQLIWINANLLKGRLSASGIAISL